MHEPRHTEKKNKKKKNKKPVSCEQLQIAVHNAIAWSFPAGKQPSFRIIQLFQTENQTIQSKGTKGNSEDKGGVKNVAPSCAFFSIPEAHIEVLYL